ncbi:MAG TPA: TorF family putative porin [Caulobacteraceae bacterium]
MKVLKLALCAAAASLAMATTAAAQDAMDVSFNVGIASDYVFRGFTQTMEDPEVFGGVDVTSGMFYAGAWASNVDFGDETDAEVDLYAGLTPTLGPVSANFGVIYYGYVNAPDGTDYDYVELKAAGSVPVGPATLGAAVFYSPEFFGKTGEAWYEEVNASFSPTDKITIGGAFGHQDVELAGDYNTWNLGATVAINDMFSVDARYHDTDLDDAVCEDVCDARGVVTLKAAF